MDSEDAIRDDTSSSLISAISLGVLILPLLALWTSSLSLARREDNPAPLAFTYMKIVYPVAFLALTFQFAHIMLEIAMRWLLMPRGPYEIPQAEPHRMAYMSNRLDALSSTLLDVTDIFLILALFELGGGLLEHVTGKGSSLPLVVRCALLLPAAIVLYLAIATHVQSYSIWSKSFSRDEDGEVQLQADIESLEEWDTPLLTLWWAASFLLFLYACFIWHKAKGNARVLDSTVTFLAATVLNLFNPVRQAVITTLDPEILECKLVKHYLYLVDDMLDYWVRFLIIAHIFAMGLPGNKGLWAAMSQLYSAPLDIARATK
ncbi:hypothetical protein NCS57_01181600 [Fusarium keratoplasticum]|uniref:Uncharacterized protein n=1 Tax=Fusarium keratoplasticum TaxID=1328300 RepID=A0ACC0QMN0_9HYPO|nr:hypothetical protein NCS57_01181600 [Fusarium keratoplasticum]KAI8658011.1 hypothetical protein NCS57_01181600 [Fusarium keratoplasticum]KAI8658969.1 hypothetical protein NCS55_01175700 [Fusarium keratoplasticum]